MHGCELRGGRGVAVGDQGGDREGDEQAAAGRVERGGPHREDPGADHRAEADGDGVPEGQAASEGHPVIVACRGERRVTQRQLMP
jgi:hypothetical protein